MPEHPHRELRVVLAEVQPRRVEQQTAVDSGIVERIGESGSVRDHREALDSVLASIDTADITAVAHRVVHGGARFTEPVVVAAEPPPPNMRRGGRCVGGEKPCRTPGLTTVSAIILACQAWASRSKPS